MRQFVEVHSLRSVQAACAGPATFALDACSRTSYGPKIQPNISTEKTGVSRLRKLYNLNWNVVVNFFGAD